MILQVGEGAIFHLMSLCILSAFPLTIMEKLLLSLTRLASHQTFSKQ